MTAHPFDEGASTVKVGVVTHTNAGIPPFTHVEISLKIVVASYEEGKFRASDFAVTGTG